MSTAPSALLATRLLALREEGPGPLLYIAVSERRAGEIARIAATLAPEAPVLAFPAWDCLPYDRASPAADIMGRRMAVLRRLEQGVERPLVVTTVEAVLQRTPPRAVAAAVPTLEVGQALDPAAFSAELMRLGYRADDRIDEPGEVAVREQVIDLYVASADQPCRLEIEDGRIQQLRSFDALTQRTTGDLARISVDAASEIVPDADAEFERTPGMEHALPDFYPALETLFEAVGAQARVVLEPEADARAKSLIEQAAGAHRDRLRWATDAGDGGQSRAVLSPERLYLTVEAWAATVADPHPFPVDDGDKTEAPRFAAERSPGRAFAAFLEQQAQAKRRIVLASTAARDLRQMTAAAKKALDRDAAPAADWAAVLKAEPGAVLTLTLDAERGFVDEASGVALVTASDVLGSRATATVSITPAAAPWQVADSEYDFGDLVIHEDHGMGVLRALETLDTEAAGRRETVRLDYAKDAHLLVPVEELDRVWRYGAEDAEVTLDRLNTEAWAKKRQAINGEIAVTARELVARAKLRDEAAGDKLAPPRGPYERFVARFPYPLTPDQASATEAMLADLASGRPMDRLVVGDVGFGKTEVAMRAAAAAALSGRQVALAAPTTVLVRQHVDSFRRRFAELGIEVAHLSRLTTPAEAQAVKAGLESGEIRVVVGTHALAADSVAFKELGLLIVDEEQRFGAAAKEKLRALGRNLHVLTLTATPIPRTLQTALVGLQDLSTIATPPARRRPVRTFTEPFDPAVVRAALTREKARGGQSFVVVPRIEDMAPMAARLAELVPGLEVVSAHGKLPQPRWMR